jgi:hypothetical protein
MLARFATPKPVSANPFPVPQPLEHEGPEQENKVQWQQLDLPSTDEIKIPVSKPFMEVIKAITEIKKIASEPYTQASLYAEIVTGIYPEWHEVYDLIGPNFCIRLAIYARFEINDKKFNARAWYNENPIYPRLTNEERYFLLSMVLKADKTFEDGKHTNLNTIEDLKKEFTKTRHNH